MTEPDLDRSAARGGALDVLVFSASDDPTTVAREWLNRPALRQLVERFGGTWPAGDPVRRIDDLVEFSEVWNKRSGRSRLDIADEGGSVPVEDVLVAATELGLVEQPPLASTSYDVALVLGGLVTGCLSRVEALHGLLEDGLDVGAIALLGSFRELHADEREMAEREAGAHATTEVDLLAEFAARLLGGGEFDIDTDGDPGAAPRLASRHAHRVGGAPTAGKGRVERRIGTLPLHVFASASSEPDIRPANTLDTYRQASTTLGLTAGQRLLLVTTRIYRYQHLDAIRGLVLPYGVTVETYGTDRATSRRDFGAAWYLQEVRSMLLSTKRLLDQVTPARTADRAVDGH